MFPIAMWDVIIVSIKIKMYQYLGLNLDRLISLYLWIFCIVLLFWFLQGSPSESDGKLPFSTWAFLSTILFGNIVIFYADSIAEERYGIILLS